MMASFLQELLIGFPFTSAAYVGEKSKRYLPDPATQYNTSTTSSEQGKRYIYRLLENNLINCLIRKREKR